MLQKILFCDCRIEGNVDTIIEILKNITANSDLIVSSNVDVKWNIVTKYYETEVSIQVRNQKDLEGFNSTCKYPAVVLLSEGKDINNIKNFWKNLDLNSNIRLLVTSESDINESVHDWCLENDFELVELYEKLTDNELEDINDEIWGWKRIKSALEANDWCNLVSESTSDEEQQCDQFEQLLGQLGEMKTRLEAANEVDRRRLAEEVTMQFWRAMGGSESELNDL